MQSGGGIDTGGVGGRAGWVGGQVIDDDKAADDVLGALRTTS